MNKFKYLVLILLSAASLKSEDLSEAAKKNLVEYSGYALGKMNVLSLKGMPYEPLALLLFGQGATSVNEERSRSTARSAIGQFTYFIREMSGQISEEMDDADIYKELRTHWKDKALTDRITKSITFAETFSKSTGELTQTDIRGIQEIFLLTFQMSFHKSPMDVEEDVTKNY